MLCVNLKQRVYLDGLVFLGGQDVSSWCFLCFREYSQTNHVSTGQGEGDHPECREGRDVPVPVTGHIGYEPMSDEDVYFFAFSLQLVS